MPPRAAYSKEHNSIKKCCLECGAFLKLNNFRDIERKKYCSRVCRSKAIGRQRDMNILWSKNNTLEVNAKKAHKGENHPKWIKDRTKLKCRLRPETNAWRDAIFKRDNYTCQECGKKGGKLSAHHKAPYSLFPKLRYDPDNGITVCHDCHKEIHAASVELFGGLTSNEMKQRGLYFAN